MHFFGQPESALGNQLRDWPGAVRLAKCLSHLGEQTLLETQRPLQRYAGDKLAHAPASRRKDAAPIASYASKQMQNVYKLARVADATQYRPHN